MPDALAPPVQLIIGRGLLTAESIAQELRERLALDLEQDYRRYDFSYRLNRAREILRTFEPLLADNLLAVDLAAWIAGYDELANDLPAWAIETFGYGRWGEPPIPPSLPGMLGDAQPEDVRFPLLEQAVKSLVERNILTREEFDRQADNAKSRAFTIAGGLTRDTIAAIHELLVDDVAEGASLTGFRERVEQALGASPIGPAHLENVFRTNVQAAFRDGREALASHPIVDEVFPYQRINAVHDSRTRPEHLALESLGIDGTNVYRRDDLPFWNTFTPPWDFNCRCNVTLLTVEAAAQAGVVEAQEWLRTGVKPPLESRLPHIPFPGNPGFGQRSGRAVAMSSACSCGGYVMRMAWDESQVERDERGRFSKVMKSSEPEKELRGIARQEAVKRAAERLAKAGASHGIVKTPEEWEQAIGASDKFETDYAFNTYFGPASSPSRFESRQAAGFDPRADTRQPEHEELAWKEYQEDMAKWRKRFEDSFDAYPHLAQAANWTVDGDDLSSSVVQLRNAGYSHEDALSELFDDTVGVAFRAAIVEAVKDLAASKGKTVDEESIKVIAAEEFLSPNWDRAFGKGADHHPALWDNLESPKYSIDPAKLEEIFAKEKEKIPKLAQKSAKAIWRDARDEIITEGQGENPTRMAWDESEHPRDESGQFTEDGEEEGDFSETDAGRRIVQQARLSAKAASKSLGIEVDEEVFGGEDAEGWHALNDDKRREHLASYAEPYAEDALADPDGKLFRSEFKAMVAERLTMVAEQIAGDAWYRQTSGENLADSFAYGELRGKPLQAFQEFRRSYFEEHPEAFDDLVQEFTSDMESNLEHDPEDDDSRKLLHKLAKLAESRDVAGVLALLDKEEQSTERHDQEAMQWASETTEFGDYLKDRIIARGKLHESERDVAHSILEDRESPLYREMKERLKTRIFEGLKGAL